MRSDPLVHAVDKVVASQNCSGCGVCAAAFPSIEMKLDERGFLRPRVQASAAQHSREAAQQFERLCPGRAQRAPARVGGGYHEILGAYVAAYTGHATDPEVRLAGSSGGVLTALAAFISEEAGGRTVVAASGCESGPTRSVPVTIQSRDSALKAAGSRYAPVSPTSKFDPDRDVALVGKPCEASGFRKWADAGDEPRLKQALVLSFFCAGTPSQLATESLVSELGVAPGSISTLRYRGGGWPGEFAVTDVTGARASTSYEDSWGRVLGKQVQSRCKLCPDGVGMDADVSVGDFWEVDSRGYPVFEEQAGSSIVIARTDRGHELLARAESAGVIELGTVDLARLAHVQPLQRDRTWTLPGRMLGRLLAGRTVPRLTGYGLVGRVFRRPRRNLRALAGTWLRTVRRRMP